MSLWEFHCSVAGWVKAHTVEKIAPPTPEEFHAAMRTLETLH